MFVCALRAFVSVCVLCRVVCLFVRVCLCCVCLCVYTYNRLLCVCGCQYVRALSFWLHLKYTETHWHAVFCSLKSVLRYTGKWTRGNAQLRDCSSHLRRQSARAVRSWSDGLSAAWWSQQSLLWGATGHALDLLHGCTFRGRRLFGSRLSRWRTR